MHFELVPVAMALARFEFSGCRQQHYTTAEMTRLELHKSNFVLFRALI